MPEIIDRANSSINQASGGISDGLFRGIVVDNKDPKKLCRLKVSVPSMSSTDMPPDGLPWAWPCTPYAGPGYGMCLIPEEGATVWVLFENGDKTKPVWIGCSFGGSTEGGERMLRSEGSDVFKLSKRSWTWRLKQVDTPYEYTSNNGNVKVLFRSPKGASFLIDETDQHESISIIDRLGQIIRMYGPVIVEYNEDNQSARFDGNVADKNLSDRIQPGNFEESYILLQSNSDVDDNNSKLKLSKYSAQLANGKIVLDLKGGVSDLIDYEGEMVSRFDKNDKTMLSLIVKLDEDDITINETFTELKEDTIRIKTGRNLIKSDSINNNIRSSVKTLSDPEYHEHEFDEDYSDVTIVNESFIDIRSDAIELKTGDSSIVLNSDGNINIHGHIELDGDMHSNKDIVADTISLMTHRHTCGLCGIIGGPV